jgi:hypothetical protein
MMGGSNDEKSLLWCRDSEDMSTNDRFSHNENSSGGVCGCKMCLTLADWTANSVFFIPVPRSQPFTTWDRSCNIYALCVYGTHELVGSLLCYAFFSVALLFLFYYIQLVYNGQYRVWAPLCDNFSKAAWYRLNKGTQQQASLMCSKLFLCVWLIFSYSFLSQLQRFSMGLRSGLLEVHACNVVLLCPFFLSLALGPP